MKLGFSAQISRKFQKTSSMKIPPVEAELFEADRQTDRQTDTPKLTVAFRNFEKGLKMSQ